MGNTTALKKFQNKIWLSSPTMHGDEQKWVEEAIRTNWVSTVGENLDEAERIVAGKLGCKYAVALSSGTAALHLAVKLAGERLYGRQSPAGGALCGHRVFCSDMTFDATVNPVAYEGGEAVFIDTEYDTWNMNPSALEKAFEIYPDVKLVVIAHLYGTPCKMDKIREICSRRGALIVEDAAESLGASYRTALQKKQDKAGHFRQQTGSLGDYGVISFNGNKIITGSAGGMLLTDDKAAADKARKWSTQSRENAPWYQHEELGYNYRMSNIIAGVIRGQLPHLEEHIEKKKAIYMRYREAFKKSGLPVTMNPYDERNSEPNFWLSCLLIDKEAMCRQMRGEQEALYVSEPQKSCPTEILETLAKCNAEGRPVWKPMHMQPIYRMHGFVVADGNGRGRSNAYIAGETGLDVGADIFERGLCLPSDIKMTEEEQDKVIEIVKGCFQ